MIKDLSKGLVEAANKILVESPVNLPTKDPNKPWSLKHNPKIIKIKTHPHDPKTVTGHTPADQAMLHAVTGVQAPLRADLAYHQRAAREHGYELHEASNEAPNIQRLTLTQEELNETEAHYSDDETGNHTLSNTKDEPGHTHLSVDGVHEEEELIEAYKINKGFNHEGKVVHAKPAGSSGIMEVSHKGKFLGYYHISDLTKIKHRKPKGSVHEATGFRYNPNQYKGKDEKGNDLRSGRASGSEALHKHAISAIKNNYAMKFIHRDLAIKQLKKHGVQDHEIDQHLPPLKEEVNETFDSRGRGEIWRKTLIRRKKREDAIKELKKHHRLGTVHPGLGRKVKKSDIAHAEIERDKHAYIPVKNLKLKEWTHVDSTGKVLTEAEKPPTPEKPKPTVLPKPTVYKSSISNLKGRIMFDEKNPSPGPTFTTEEIPNQKNEDGDKDKGKDKDSMVTKTKKALDDKKPDSKSFTPKDKEDSTPTKKTVDDVDDKPVKGNTTLTGKPRDTVEFNPVQSDPTKSTNGAMVKSGMQTM